MKGVTVIRGVLVSLAAVGFCLPHTAFAAERPSGQMPGVIDVALSNGGRLDGQVVNAQGTALKNVTVSVRRQGQEVAKTRTDDRGYFAVRGLRSGMYQVVAAKGYGMYRLWAPGLAPPSSQKGVLVVAGGNRVRGQGPLCGDPCGQGQFCMDPCCWACSPWFIGGLVAASIAVPIVVHNGGRPKSP